MENPTLTAVPGLAVGHWTDPDARTGCTVVLCPEEGCVASGLALGGAPGTRELALLDPEKTVERVHAVLLAGGSAFGLAAADGVMRWLEQQGRGFPTPYGPVPIVPAAVIFDLAAGRADVRPDAGAGYAAAAAASSAPVPLGRVGAGAGAMVGKYAGFAYAAPGGLGSAVRRVGGAVVAALAVCNALGDIHDPDTGARVAGSASPGNVEGGPLPGTQPGTNTTLVVVATDAPLTKPQARQLAVSAHAGVARVTRPSHTPQDGDTAFALSTGRGPSAPLMALSVAAQEAVAAALVTAVQQGRG